MSKVKIKNMGTVITGKTPNTKIDDYFNGDILFITPSDITSGGFINSTERTITKKGLASIEANSINGISILVGCIGSIGIVAWTNKKCATNQQINSITNIKSEYNPFYIYYALMAQKKHLQQLAGITVAPILPKSVFEEIELELPCLYKQNLIANILKSLDKKIENNNKINTELESLAKTIYDYWFLQYEFPNEEGKPYKSSDGKMVWNEELKRGIPENWEVKNILETCDIIDCLHSKKPEYCYENDDCYLLTTDNLTHDGYIDTLNKFYISKNDYQKWTKKIELTENDFVVTNAGRAGDIIKIPTKVQCAIGRNITAIRPQHISPYYLRQFFKSDLMKKQIFNNLDCGSFFMSFNVKSIKNINILIPDNTTMGKANEQFKNIILKVEENVRENQELISLRDWLLPLLINGQVGFCD